MKKDLKIKLNQLNKAELSEKEMNRLLGGDRCCICGCEHIGNLTFDSGIYNYSSGDSGYSDEYGGWGNGSFG